MDAERDKREAREKMYFERYSPVIIRILMYMCMKRLIKYNLAIHYFQIGVLFCPETNNSYCEKTPDRTAVGIVVVVHFIIEFR